MALLVPRLRRDRWSEEWRAEVWCALAAGRRSSAWRRLLGAPRDALLARRRAAGTVYPELPGGPRRGADALLHDGRQALRALRARPGFAALSVALLALGIGANITLFSVAREALLLPLPYPDPDRLVLLYESRPQQGRTRNSVSYPDYLDWRARTTSFEAMAAHRFRRVTFASDPPLPLPAELVTWEFFRALGVQPALGRDFEAADDAPGAAGVVILSHGLWQEAFGGDPGVLGTDVVIEEEPRTVIGVLPEGVPAYPFYARAWMPLGLDPAGQRRGSHSFRVLGRMAAGVQIDEARGELGAVARALAREYPEDSGGHFASLFAFHHELTREARGGVVLLLALASLVLLIVCANLASMQLAHAIGRQQEIAVRVAVGASRRRLLTMLFIESLLLGGLAALVGVAFAAGLRSWLTIGRTPWQPQVTGLPTTLAVAAILAMVTAVLFGLLPALRLSRASRYTAVRAAAGSVQGGVRSALVVVEVALALFLLVGAGLLLRSFVQLVQVDPGFHTEQALAAEIALPEARYAHDSARAAFFDELLEAVGGIAGTESVGLTSSLPLGGSYSSSLFAIEGRPEPVDRDSLATDTHVVTPGYLPTLGVRLLAGRALVPADSDPEAEGVVVVNDTLAGRFFPDGDAVGQRLRIWGDSWLRIVGVVSGVRHRDLRQPPPPETYAPLGPLGVPSRVWLVIRTTEPRTAVVAALRERLAEIDGGLPFFSITAMDDFIARSLQQPRRLAQATGLFGAIAALIAALGVYGVISYAVGQRRQEIGLRIALGSSRCAIVRLVLTAALRLVLLGLALGGAAALVGGRALGGLLYGVAPGDALALLGAVALLMTVALMATLVPAWRAARVDPATSLRAE